MDNKGASGAPDNHHLAIVSIMSDAFIRQKTIRYINMQSDPLLKEWQLAGDYHIVPPLNLRVFYRDVGKPDAPPDKTVLLLHGFPESSFSYHKIMPALAERFERIVLFDMLGYGVSDKPGGQYSYSLIPQTDVALQIWQHLGVSGGHIISHDMGTSVLTEIAARQVNGQLPAFFVDGIKSMTFTNGSMVLGLARLRLMQRLLLSPIAPVMSMLASYRVFRHTLLSAHGAPAGSPMVCLNTIYNSYGKVVSSAMAIRKTTTLCVT